MTDKSAQPVWRPLILSTLVFSDAAASLAVLALAAYLDRFALDVWLSLVVAIAVPVGLSFAGAYRWEGLAAITDQIRHVAAAVTTIFMMLLLIAFLFRTTADWSRLFALGSWAGLIVVLSLSRGVLAILIARWRAEGRAQISIALVGANDLAHELLNYLRSNASYYEVVGIFDDRQTRHETARPGTIIRGNVEDLKALRRERHIDQVIVTIPPQNEARVLSLIEKIKDISVDIRLAMGGTGLQFMLRDLSHIGGYPVFHVTERPLSDFDVAIKRTMDLVLATLALVGLSPLLLLVALAIKLESPGPVVFRQHRYGFNNTIFEIYKFRTMRHDAPGADGSDQARPGDGRVTRIGAILRRWSVDELAQLFNVLKGDMSLVGPRPHPVTMRAVDQPYEAVVRNYASRHRMRPGMTGWAQVNGWRGQTDTIERARTRIEYDIHYIEHWSILFDLEILALTLPAVVAGRNAL